MRTDRQLAVLDRLLDVVTRGEMEAGSRDSHLEVERYTSRERFDAEREILRSSPVLVGRESELPDVGSFFTHDATGVPILVTRSPGGGVSALVNVCPHRGARVVTEERGSTHAFVCPFHGWSYDLRGSLAHVAVPRFFPRLRREEVGLAPLPCAVRHGFIWVVPSPNASFDAATWLGDFDDDLARFDLARHVVFRRSHTTRAAGWKLVMDVLLDGTHVKTLNARTLGRLLREDSIADASGPHGRSARARRNLPEIANHPRDRWSLREYAVLVYLLFPNTVVVVHADAISVLSVFPATIETCEVVHTMLVPNDSRDYEATWRLLDEDVLGSEDLPMAESVQAGLDAHRTSVFRLGTAEQLVRAFHETLDRAIDRQG